MTLLVFGIVFFLLVHSIGMKPGLRATLSGAMGRGVFRGAYSVVSLIGIVLVIRGFETYRDQGMITVWDPPTALRHLNMLFMLFSFIALSASLSPRGFIKARLKHPMLVGVKAWALGHLLANGDLGGMVLFGGFLAWAVVDRISFRWRPVGDPPPEPRIMGDVIAVTGGLFAYGVMINLHPLLFGVSVFG